MPQNTAPATQTQQYHQIISLIIALFGIFFRYPISFISGLFSSSPNNSDMENSAATLDISRLAPIDRETNDPVANLNDISLENQPNEDLYIFPQIPLSTLHKYADSKFIYVGINGNVYDVSHRPEAYGSEGSYGLFSNKDASRALAMSSLQLKDIKDSEGNEGSLVGLDEKQYKTLKQWEDFFQQRYRIVARIPIPQGEDGYQEYLKNLPAEGEQ